MLDLLFGGWLSQWPSKKLIWQWQHPVGEHDVDRRSSHCGGPGPKDEPIHPVAFVVGIPDPRFVVQQGHVVSVPQVEFQVVVVVELAVARLAHLHFGNLVVVCLDVTLKKEEEQFSN